MIGQYRQVFHAFAQGRQFDGDDVEAVIQILAELALVDQLFGFAVGGGDDAHVDGDRFASADFIDFVFLQDAQEFRLERRRHFGDFI